MKERIKLALFALTAAYVALLPQFYEIFNRENRFTMLWDRAYHASIATAILVLAAVYVAVYAIIYLRWRPAPGWRIARDTVLVVVLMGLLTRTVISILDRTGIMPTSLAFLFTRAAKGIYYLVVPLALTALNPFVAKRAVRRLYSCLAPMMIIGLVWPLTYRTFDIRQPPIPAELAKELETASTRGTTNVYIFMLDEWSYDRTFPDGKLLEGMPRLGELLGRATLYSNARSPGPTTAISIPRFLFQNNVDFRALSYEQVKTAALSRDRIPGATLFSESPSNYFKMAIGFWIDYRDLLGTNVDYACTIHQEAATRTYGLQTRTLLFSQMGWLRHFGVQNLQKPLHPSLVWIFSQEQAHRWALLTIERLSQPTFALFHYCLPHYPYVWNADGMKSPIPENPVDHTPENYRDNLMYLDRVIGEIIDALKKTDKFESSTLILTSDHAWRLDPAHSFPDWVHEDLDPKSELRHVPLIVKLPHQEKPAVIDEPVSTTDLHAIVRHALAEPHPVEGSM